jgi:hypothetical protein
MSGQHQVLSGLAAQYIGPAKTRQIDATWLEPGEFVMGPPGFVKSLLELGDFKPVDVSIDIQAIADTEENDNGNC